MLKRTLRVRYDNCRLKLSLPFFFAHASFEQIRDVMKMLQERPHQNDVAFETIDRFLPEWLSSIDNIDEETKRAIRASNAVIEKKIKSEKNWLAKDKKIVARYAQSKTYHAINLNDCEIRCNVAIHRLKTDYVELDKEKFFKTYDRIIDAYEKVKLIRTVKAYTINRKLRTEN